MKGVMKNGLFICISLIMLCQAATSASAWSSFRDEVAAKTPGVTSFLTPTNPDTVGAKWELRLASGTNLAYNSSPIIMNNQIYVVCTNQLYQLDLQGTIQRKLPLAASMNSVCRMAYEKDRLYIPLGNGVMECVDTKNWQSLWVGERFNNQSLTNVTIIEDMVIAGTGYQHGLFYGVDKNTGKTIWTYASENDAGYYWSGASKTKNGDLVFAGDDGVIVSHSADSEKVFDTLDANELAKEKLRFRSGVVYDEGLDRYFLISTSGVVFRFSVNEDGTFGEVSFVRMLQEAKAGEINCTATPAIYNGRMYVGGYWKNGGFFVVFDPAKMQEIYYVKSTSYFEFKGSPVVCTSYGTEQNKEKVYVYFTMNGVPGGIYYIEDNQEATRGEIKMLFAPETHKQFCMDSVAVGEDGTLYYSNDSGYLFAVQAGYKKPAIIPTNPPSQTVVKVTPDKPTKIKGKCKKKKGKWKITLTWKKGKNAAKTQITPKGAKTKLTSKSKYVFYSRKRIRKVTFVSISKDGIKSGKKTVNLV